MRWPFSKRVVKTTATFFLHMTHLAIRVIDFLFFSWANAWTGKCVRFGCSEHLGQVLACIGRRNRRPLASGVPVGDDVAAGIAAFRTEVDDVVCGLDDIEIVLDDQDGITIFSQPGKMSTNLCTSAICRPVVGSSRM